MADQPWEQQGAAGWQTALSSTAAVVNVSPTCSGHRSVLLLIPNTQIVFPTWNEIPLHSAGQLGVLSSLIPPSVRYVLWLLKETATFKPSI